MKVKETCYTGTLREVFVGRNETVEVSDHDFCNFSVISSVSFVLNIPEDFDQSGGASVQN